MGMHTADKKLTRQRFFELRGLIEDFNKDRINLQQFTLQLTSSEAKAYGIMYRKAKRNLELVVFADQLQA